MDHRDYRLLSSRSVAESPLWDAEICMSRFRGPSAVARGRPKLLYRRLGLIFLQMQVFEQVHMVWKCLITETLSLLFGRFLRIHPSKVEVVSFVGLSTWHPSWRGFLCWGWSTSTSTKMTIWLIIGNKWSKEMCPWMVRTTMTILTRMSRTVKSRENWEKSLVAGEKWTPCCRHFARKVYLSFGLLVPCWWTVGICIASTVLLLFSHNVPSLWLLMKVTLSDQEAGLFFNHKTKKVITPKFKSCSLFIVSCCTVQYNPLQFTKRTFCKSHTIDWHFGIWSFVVSPLFGIAGCYLTIVDCSHVYKSHSGPRLEAVQWIIQVIMP